MYLEILKVTRHPDMSGCLYGGLGRSLGKIDSCFIWSLFSASFLTVFLLENFIGRKSMQRAYWEVIAHQEHYEGMGSKSEKG